MEFTEDEMNAAAYFAERGFDAASTSSCETSGDQKDIDNADEEHLWFYCPYDGAIFRNGICVKCRRGRRYATKKPPTRPRFRKILYDQQPYSDNHVDSSFLIELLHNSRVVSLDFGSVVKSCTVITQQFSMVVLFLLAFIYSYRQILSTAGLIIIDSLLLLLCFLTTPQLLKYVISLCVLFVVLFFVSPVLHTLTDPFSTDTVWWLTAISLLIHLFFHDYKFSNEYSFSFQAPMSLNTGLLASILLGSRLQSSIQVFALISCAVILFGISPLTRHHIMKFSQRIHFVIVLTMIFFSFIGMYYVNHFAAHCFSILIVFINVLCPIWLINIQKYKNEINGPWDEKIPLVTEDPDTYSSS